MYEISHMLGNKRGSVIKVSFPHAPSPPSRPPLTPCPPPIPLSLLKTEQEPGGRRAGLEPGHSRSLREWARIPAPGEGESMEDGSRVFQGRGASRVAGMASGGMGTKVDLLAGACGAGPLAGPGCLGRKCPLCC